MQIVITCDSFLELGVLARELAGVAGDVNVKLDVDAEVVKKAGKDKPKKEATKKEEPVELAVGTPENTYRPESDPEPVTESEPEPEEKAVTMEEVRAKLAALSKAGKKAEVQELIKSFGADKLSGISADRYGELMAKAGEL